MARRDGQNGHTDAHERLRNYCIRVIRFISDGALDPHLYFEKKLTGDVAVAGSVEELLGILIGLIESIGETPGDAIRLSGFDQALAGEGLPSLSLLRAPATRSAGFVLARSRIRTPAEFRLVGDLAGDGSISDADRCVAERLLDEYEQN